MIWGEVGESEGGVAGGEEVAGEERRRFGLHNDPNVCLSVCLSVRCPFLTQGPPELSNTE